MEVKHDQHMMVASDVIRRIVELAGIRPGETVLEIGAGSGNLTRALAAKAGKKGKVIAVEIDKKYAAELKKIRNVKVITGNALKEIDGLEFDRLVANIPYAICEPLIGMLAEKEFKLAILTVPKGFAGIVTAKKGSKAYSKTSIMTRVFFDIEVVLDVPREAFEPAPKTDSVVIRVLPRAGNDMQKELLKRMELKVKNAIMRALFVARKSTKNQARKDIKTLKLNNNLLEKRLLDADSEELDIVLASLEKL
jgi:16S rRNA (adenine1518-N6/adenine1519-N6)-dimethyltransferase